MKEGIRMNVLDRLLGRRYLEWNEYEKLMDSIEQREEYPRHLSK